MFLYALAGAIDAALPKQLDYLSHQLWQGHRAGHIPDQEAQALAERLQSRRSECSGVAQGALFQLADAGLRPPRSHWRHGPSCGHWSQSLHLGTAP
jgi:hypothetical protein